MNWKEEAIERLESYRAMRRSLKTIPTEMRRLECQAKLLGSVQLDVMPRGVRARNREDRILSNAIRYRELELSLEQARLWVEAMDESLAVLEEDHRLILELLYIEKKADALQILARRLGLEKTSIYRHRDRALRHFVLSLYGPVGV